MLMANELVEIANFRTKAEAELAAAVLENEGIGYLIQSQEGMLHGPLTPGASILVSAEDADEARELIGEET